MDGPQSPIPTSDVVDRFGLETTLERLFGDMLDRRHHSQSRVVEREANKAKRGVILPGGLKINRGDATGGIITSYCSLTFILGSTH